MLIYPFIMWTHTHTHSLSLLHLSTGPVSLILQIYSCVREPWRRSTDLSAPCTISRGLTSRTFGILVARHPSVHSDVGSDYHVSYVVVLQTVAVINRIHINRSVSPVNSLGIQETVLCVFFKLNSWCSTCLGSYCHCDLFFCVCVTMQGFICHHHHPSAVESKLI